MIKKLKSIIINEYFLYEEIPIIIGVNKRCGFICRHCKKWQWDDEKPWGYFYEKGGDTDMMLACACNKNTKSRQTI